MTTTKTTANPEKDIKEIKTDIEVLRSDISDLVASLSQTGKNKLNENVQTVIGTAKDYADQTTQRAQQSKMQIESQIQQNPLDAVAAAFGVGFVLGKLLEK